MDDAEPGHGPLPRAGPGGGVAAVGEAVVDWRLPRLEKEHTEALASSAAASARIRSPPTSVAARQRRSVSPASN